MSDTSKHIRALDRGLAVVEHLSNRGLSPLADIRQATGLSNATLLRLLATLQARGWVRRNIVEGHYELAHSLGALLGAGARANPLVELAAPIMLEMPSRALGLPSDLCTILRPGMIEVVESTRMRGPMAPVRTGLGIRPSMVLSAHGRAMLAHLSEAERDVHLAKSRQGATRAEALWLVPGKLAEMLRQTRNAGYGLREADYWVESAFDPGPDLGAIAVPILSSSGLFGSISVLWLREEISLQRVLELGAFDHLRQAALRIGAACDKAGLVAPSFAPKPAAR